MATPQLLHLDMRVTVAAGTGTIRFIGPTAFAAGKWIGIALDQPRGKNDGSLGGQRYFECKMNWGVFVRPAQIKPLLNESTTTSTTTERAVSSPPRRGAGATSSSLSVRSSAAAASERTMSALGRRTPSPPHPSSSLQLDSNARQTAIAPYTAARVLQTTFGESKVERSEGQESTEEQEEKERLKEKKRIELFSLRGVESKTLAEATVPKKEHEEVLAKLRILEARRAEDRERLREVDRLRDEAEEWIRVREKSKIRITELSTEVKELRKQTKELVVERDTFQSDFADLTDQVEISLLDKEVAEERFEVAESALEVARERCAEIEVEVAVLREENARMDGSVISVINADGTEADSGRNSLAFVKMEKQNGRLKEALVRLRDTTSEAEAEYRKRISDTEKELELTYDLQVLYDTTAAQLERAEGQVEDLKVQLDDALGAEDMLEQLTDRNLSLTDKVEELQAAVEDLEAIRDLNDELEENHVETEHQMQGEIDLKDLSVRDQRRQIGLLEESLADYESTIGQFRELVISLQLDLEESRQHRADQEPESQSLKSQSQAMMSLNLKLQSSVLKGQVKTIELDLRKLDASQAVERLSIIRPYILPSYFDEDADAVDALLFFERSAAKAELMSSVIELTHSVTESLNTIVPEDLVQICETRTKLARFASISKRFAAQLKRCSPELFLSMGRVYYDVISVEKRLDHHIDTLARNEFRETECGRELDGFIAQIQHLAELHLQDPVLDLAERQHSSISILDLDLDTIAAAIGFTKQTLVTVAQASDDPTMEGQDLKDLLFTPLQNLVNSARNSKVVAKKLLRRLEDLMTSSSALNDDHSSGIETLSHNSSAIAVAAGRIASEIGRYCADLHASKGSLELAEVVRLVREVVASELGRPSSKPFEEIKSLLSQLGQDIGTTIAAALNTDQVVKLAYIPPWIERVTKLQSQAAIIIDAERQVITLNEEIRDLVRERRSRELVHSEDSVKIELMEKRMDIVKKQAEAAIELESELAKARKSEHAYEEAMEVLQKDLDEMEAEVVKLKATRPAPSTDLDPSSLASTTFIHVNSSTAHEGNLETSRLVEQIASLRGAVRFLRSENALLKSQDLLSELDALPSYRSSTALLDLATSTVSDSTDDRDARTGKDDAEVQDRLYASSLKSLLHEARILSSTPKLVDLSLASVATKGSTSGIAGTSVVGKAGWRPLARAPESQWMVEKERTRELSRKLEKLGLGSMRRTTIGV